MDPNIYGQISIGNTTKSSLLLHSHVCDSQSVSTFHAYLTLKLFLESIHYDSWYLFLQNVPWKTLL